MDSTSLVGQLVAGESIIDATRLEDSSQQAADDSNSPSSAQNDPQTHSRVDDDSNTNISDQMQATPTVYGELSILGYNGSIPHSDRNNKRAKSKFLLCQRPTPNGIKKSKHYIVKQPQATKAIRDKELHSISYTFSRSQAIIVEYAQDDETDLFQIGRSSESPIDFVVNDTVQNNGINRPQAAAAASSSSSHPIHHGSHNNHSHHRSSHKTQHSENNFSSQLSELVPTHLLAHANQLHNQLHTQHASPPSHLIKAPDHSHTASNLILHHTSHQNRQYGANRDNMHILLDNPNQNCINFLNYRFPHLSQDPRHLISHQSSAVVATAHISGAAAGVSNPSKNHNSSHHHSSPAQSTISRFACRILVERKPPYTARIYAAGFDSSKNIFLGEKATKWEQDNSIDGLTTNGVLLMHPKSGYFCEEIAMNDSNNNEKSATGGVWREVSVDGGIYAIRESRSAAQKGIKIDNECNILKDGTLIDLCGATLLWRSLEGFKRAPTKRTLEEKIDSINASRPQCPVGLNTLIIPRKPVLSYHRRNEIIRDSDGSNQQPYVYLKCGHVQGLHDWGATKLSNQRKCPICFSVGTVSKLTIGIEPSFYVDSKELTHVFNPCGHMASEKTIKYWCSVKIPHGTHFFNSICPFCALPLSTVDQKHTKLIFQDYVD